MAGLLDKPTTDDPQATAPVAAPEAPLPAAPDDASRLCVGCAALLEPGQDWCLECGTAQPGRLGGRPGWRAALTVVGITSLLAAGAIAAGYAALSSEAERRAAAPAPPAAQPSVPPPPATPAPPAEEPEAVAPPEQPKAEEPRPVEPPQREEPAPPSDPAPAAPPPPAGDTDGGDDGDGAPAAEPEKKPRRKPSPIVALAPGAASTYDPMQRGGNLTGDPAESIDGNKKTAWEAPVGQDGRVDIGLLISLEKLTAMKSLRLLAGTPGFTVELYGATSRDVPEGDVLNPEWKQLDLTRDFGTDERLTIGGKYRHVLLWFTEQPADTKVMIPEVELRR